MCGCIGLSVEVSSSSGEQKLFDEEQFTENNSNDTQPLAT